MGKGTVIELRGPEGPKDALTTLLQKAAQELLRQAVESELEQFLQKHTELKLADGRQRIVLSGYLPSREVQTQFPSKCRGLVTGGMGLLGSPAPFCRRIFYAEELLPWLYLKGISTHVSQRL